MKFAFLIMGPFDSEKDKSDIKNNLAQIVGVKSIEDACKTAVRLVSEGVECIELCGAFGEKGAEEVIKATENKIPVGYVTHLPMQNEIYHEVFGE